MGEIADSLINGDCCEQCGQYLGEGGGFPRTCSGCSGSKKKSQLKLDADGDAVCKYLHEFGFEEDHQKTYWLCKYARENKIVSIDLNVISKQILKDKKSVDEFTNWIEKNATK